MFWVSNWWGTQVLKNSLTGVFGLGPSFEMSWLGCFGGVGPGVEESLAGRFEG